MRRKDLATNIALSLVAGAWTEASLRSTLARRLPPALHADLRMIAAWLVTILPRPTAPPLATVAAALNAMPEFDAIHDYCLKHDAWPAPVLSPTRMHPAPALTDLDLPQLHTVRDLADWLLIPVDHIDYFADPTGRHEAHDEMAINHYTYTLIRKTQGRVRVIEAPKPGLKALQRRILNGIIAKVPVHPDAFGFVAGRSCVQAATRHAGEAVVLRFDFRDFFPSLGAGRVHGLFRTLGYPEPVARLLTGFCTTRTPERILMRLPPASRTILRARHLPQGAPTSPALSNLIAFRLDQRFAGLARSLDASYSRYADDMVFSGDPRIAPALLTLVPRIARDEGLILNPAKTRLMPAGGRQVVTGLVVNARVNIDRRHFDHLKAVIHALGRADDPRPDDPAFMASLLGQIGWVGQVSPPKADKLRHLLARAIARRT